MKNFCLWRAWLLAFFFFLSACDRSPRAGSQVIVQVNESQLNVKEFAENLTRIIKDHDALTAKDPQYVNLAKDKVVQDFIMRIIAKDAAKNLRLSLTEVEVDEEIKNRRSEYPDDSSFRKVLAQENLSLKQWKHLVESSLLEHKLLKKISEKVPEPKLEDLRKYYQDNKTKYQRKERIYIRQIVVDNLTKAKALHEEAKKKDFSELARKYSVSPEAKDGGLVGWIEKGSVDIFDKAFYLKIGAISEALESSYGFHIFKVERKAPAGFSSFEEVQKSIRFQLKAQNEQAVYLNWLDQQIRSTKVLKNTELIQAISVETKGLR
ncbi:MAG: peptidyl-prolyl cis-trans isomerase [Bdellovibrio sp.]